MEKPKLIDLPKYKDPRGNLTFIQNNDHIPFEIKRVFWTYNVPGGEARKGHAYYQQKELIVALSGSFDVVVTDIKGTQSVFSLNRSFQGLYLPANTWRHLNNFATNSLSMHLASTAYNAADYQRDFKAYLSEK